MGLIPEIASNLKIGADGIWYAAEQTAVSYPADGNNRCFEIEDNSFWFRHRNACIVELVNKLPPQENSPILDVGGGNGFVAKGLIDAGHGVVLVEPGLGGARNARARGLQHVVCATTQAAEFKAERVAGIGIFDVLEHVEDDSGFLRHLHDLLQANGMIYLTVPAAPCAWSDEDVHAGHFRRYTRHSLSTRLKDAGLEVVFITSIFSWLLLPVILLRAVPYRLHGVTSGQAAANSMRADHSLPRWIEPFVRAIDRWELKKISQRQPIPVGSSLLCAAQK